jgi:hypothetical protein
MWLIPRSTEIDLTSVGDGVLTAEARSEMRLHWTINLQDEDEGELWGL